MGHSHLGLDAFVRLNLLHPYFSVTDCVLVVLEVVLLWMEFFRYETVQSFVVWAGGRCSKFSLEFEPICEMLILLYAYRAFKRIFDSARSLMTDCISGRRCQNSRGLIVNLLNFGLIFLIVPLVFRLIDSFLMK